MSKKLTAEERAEIFWQEIHKYGAGPYESKQWLREHIRAAEQAAQEDEREACAMVADQDDRGAGRVAIAIRARGKK